MKKPSATIAPTIEEAWSDEERDEFAEERSHEASKISYDLGKAVGQAGLLINGGAATAVIALLAKDKVDPALLKSVPWCLAIYAIGVASSAIMLFCAMMLADHWNYFWYHFSYTADEARARSHEAKATFWQTGVRVAWTFTIICFIIASLGLALAMSATK